MFGLRRKSSQLPPDQRSHVLLRLSARDSISVAEFLNGGCAVYGRSGSGKTSSSGRALATALVADLPGSGGLIAAAKPEDREFWSSIFEKAHRQLDLVVFGPNEAARFNFIDYEAAAGGHARNITRTIMVIGETLRSSDTKGGEDGDFWEKQQERLIYNAVVIVKLATGRVTAPELQQFISTAAQTPEQLASDEWQKGFHNGCLKAAFEKKKSAIDGHDCQLAIDFWAGEMPKMSDRTKSSILAGVLGILHTYNTGIVRELVSTTSTITPDDLFKGKWVLVDMPPAEWGDIGSFVAGGWKYLTQRAILRRHAKAGDNVVVIWCDEAAQFVNSFDSHFLAQCRSHRGCMVYLAQSLHSYYAALKGQAGRHQADALMSNFYYKIFHSLGDVDSSSWASSLIGRELRTFIGGSTQRDEDPFGLLMGGGSATGSFSESYEAILQPNEFMTGLRDGGIENGLLCDAIVMRSGKPFANGQNWIKVAFSQR